MQDKRLLVVGGTGVISFAVVNEALKQGWKVTCINRGISHTQTLSPDVEQIISDYRNETLIRPGAHQVGTGRLKIEHGLKRHRFRSECSCPLHQE